MNWGKLVNRCRLFEKDAPKPLLKELLMEAEEEMCRHIPILERKKLYQGPFTTEEISNGVVVSTQQDWFLLPQDFSKMKYVYCNGIKLDTISQDEIYYDENSRPSSGQPDGYYIHNDRIYFNTIPSKEKILIEYFAHLTPKVRNKDFEILDTVSIPLDTGIVIQPQAIPVTSLETNVRKGGTVGTPTILSDDFKSDQSFLNVSKGKIARDEYGFCIDTDLGENLIGYDVIYGGSMSSIVSCSETPHNGIGYTYGSSGSAPTVGEILTVVDYRELAPIIPVQYHKDLCDYALYTATGNDGYFAKWGASISIIEAENEDRDLDHNIKEVI